MAKSKLVLERPTKRSLINFLEQLPYSDDQLLNVSLDRQDIYLIGQVQASQHPNNERREFLLDFSTE